MLFNFELTPLDRIQPWGEPGRLSLHWFGLTNGRYWIEAGTEVLFKYSDHAHWQLGAPQYCEYQVVRLYEDLLSILPFMLEPVPASLIPCISGEAGKAWGERRFKWLNADNNPLDDDQVYEIADATGSWVWNRTLDSAYLRPSAVIRMWSDELTVHIEWDNRDRLVDGVQAWSASCGAYCLSREQFIAEVRSFHERLMQQMAERIQQVVDGALPAEVRVDLPGLQREHVKRSELAEITFLSSHTPTDWKAVEAARQVLEQEHAPGT